MNHDPRKSYNYHFLNVHIGKHCHKLPSPRQRELDAKPKVLSGCGVTT